MAPAPPGGHLLKCLEKEPGDRYSSAEARRRTWGAGCNTAGRMRNGRGRLSKPAGSSADGSSWQRRWRRAAWGRRQDWRGGWSLRPDPDAELKEIQRRLARGETIELIGSGPTSGPAWSHVAKGSPTTDRSPSDHEVSAPVLRPTRHVGSSARHTRHRVPDFSAVRHESDQNTGGAVGLYLGRKAYSSPSGVGEAFVQLTFNDITNPRDSVETWNATHPTQPPRPVDN